MLRSFIISLLFLLPTLALAQGYTQLEPLPLGQGSPASNFGDYANQLFSIALALGGALAAVMLTIGGVQYMLSEAVGAKEEGRARIRNAILGIFLLFGTYLILDTINPNLVKFDLSQIGPVGAVINTRQVSLNRTVDPRSVQAARDVIVGAGQGSVPPGAPASGYFVIGRAADRTLVTEYRATLEECRALIRDDFRFGTGVRVRGCTQYPASR